MGNALPYPIIFDHLVLDACQVTNPSIDPLREPMELRTLLGKKPDKVEFEKEKVIFFPALSFKPQLTCRIKVISVRLLRARTSGNRAHNERPWLSNIKFLPI